MLVSGLAMLMLAPDPSVLVAPRKAFEECLADVEASHKKDDTPPRGYASAVDMACKGQEAMLVKALVDFDVANGTKRAEAKDYATMDIEDYRDRAKMRYEDYWELDRKKGSPSEPPQQVAAATPDSD
ncbi:hypothetical protein [Sphingomicrobium nitratireducens]|uniref:hypothetical protein n=1 Tax=Sphingomicrobium nitratireducens TaxID=2964666 RepID=UPI00223FDD50|nr:hypothetical protein [Sphingomicrobium nitratireducens]